MVLNVGTRTEVGKPAYLLFDMKTTRKEALVVGESAYYTGKSCVQGHISPRRTKTGECLACRKAAVARWRKRNLSAVKKHNKTQYARHREALKKRVKMYASANRDIVLAKKKVYQKNNLHLFAKIKAKRRAAKLQRTPAWLTEDDFWLIEQAYELASMRTKMFGFVWHVDHVVPLQGKCVSGLHLPCNLQVIPGIQNRRKSNNFIEAAA